jgi:hypothetical protein
MPSDLARAVEIYAVVHFTVIGISHLIQPRVWIDLFIRLRELGHVGVFLNGFLSLLFGSIIVAFHDIWLWPSVILTLIGWAQILKALIAFALPSLAMRSLNRVSTNRAWEIQLAGAVFLGLAVWLALRIAS